MNRRHWMTSSMALMVLAKKSFAQSAQPFPQRAIRAIVPFPAGGSPDILGRFVGERLHQFLGHGFAVENRAGANGLIGMDAVAKAAPDGYTLSVSSTSPLTVNPVLNPNTPYDPLKDFEPVIHLGQSALVLLATAGLPASNMQELIELARSKPGEITYGSAGEGNLTHLAGELLKQEAKIDIRHVPYKGTAQARPDLISGRISILFETTPAAVPMLAAKQVKPLGVTTPQRAGALPDVATFSEQSVPGEFDVSGWYAILAPKGTPQQVVDRLNAAINEVLRSQEAVGRFKSLGVDITGGPPAYLTKIMTSELARWKQVVQTAGIKVG